MEKSSMENPSRCLLLPEELNSPREEELVVVVVEEEQEEEVVDEDVVVFEAEVALVEVPRLMSRVETGLVPTVLVAT